MRNVRENRLHEQIEKVSSEVDQLRAENARLRRDNERFVRLIDSGEWGRGRVEELKRVIHFATFADDEAKITQAGEILKSERDALNNLVKTLRLEYETMQKTKERQEQELHDLKHRVVSGGGSSPAARNKMLVRGASSFNSLVRALKQDLLDHPETAKKSSLMLEIDKMAMDKVHVFPDGELKIEAVKKAREQSTPSFR